jgi:hypothetical protein
MEGTEQIPATEFTPTGYEIKHEEGSGEQYVEDRGDKLYLSPDSVIDGHCFGQPLTVGEALALSYMPELHYARTLSTAKDLWDGVKKAAPEEGITYSNDRYDGVYAVWLKTNVQGKDGNEYHVRALFQTYEYRVKDKQEALDQAKHHPARIEVDKVDEQREEKMVMSVEYPIRARDIKGFVEADGKRVRLGLHSKVDASADEIKKIDKDIAELAINLGVDL